MELAGVCRGKSPLMEREGDPTALGVMRIEINDGQNDIIQMPGLLAVRDELFVVRLMEFQALVAVQRRVFPADAVDSRNQVGERSWGIEIPIPDFKLLGVQILLAAWLTGLVLTKLKGRAVEAIACAECRSQDQPSHESRFATVLEVLGQDVGGVRPKI